LVARTDQSEIQQALGYYRNAYELLDAHAARAVWPSVDVRALARAFDTLTSQQLAFETCRVAIAGEEATAQCTGSASYTPKIGNRGPRHESREWTFYLRKATDGWKIQSAQTKR
jgi:ketosteroid isomerase-like protein